MAATSTLVLAASILGVMVPRTTAGFGPIACFADGTMMTVKSGVGQKFVRVENLRPGDEVATMDESRLVWTKVVMNKRTPATSQFVRVAARDTASNLTITEGHMSPRFARANEANFARFDVVRAQDLAVGDWAPMFRHSELVEDHITSVERIPLPYKNTLVTAMGTVVANGFLTTCVCDDFPRSQNMSHFLTKWRLDHQAKIM